MEIEEYTRTELIHNIQTHTAHWLYDNETDLFSIPSYSGTELLSLDDTALIDIYHEYCSSHNEIIINITKKG